MESGSVASTPARLLSLDVLRGIAILLVLGRHTVAPAEGLGWLQPVVRGWTHIGWSGVDLFFVLSGFLVSGLIFSEYRRRADVDVRRFIIRRGFKIWPPYLAYLGFVAAWLAWKQHVAGGEGVWAQIWPNLLHVQNYFHTPRVHTWSLAVEEHFYLVVALGFWWTLVRGRVAALWRWLPAGVALTVAALAAWRSAVFLRVGPEAMNLYATHLRFDGLLIGTLVAYGWHFTPERLAPLVRRPFVLMGVGVILALPAWYFSPEASPWIAGPGLSALYLGFALVLLGWLHAARSGFGARLLKTRAAARLGSIGVFSYSIYLWHVDLTQTPIHKAVQFALARELAPAGVVWFGATTLYVFAAVAVGWLMARLLEFPSLALRDRFFPRMSKPLTTRPAISVGETTGSAVVPTPLSACNAQPN